jgi:chromosome segregation ATPase
MLFMACCLLTAFTLGFGIRFQSLERARKLLERDCDIIQTKIIRISRPLQIYLTEEENKQFNAKFIQIRDEIMDLMLSRTRATRNAINTPVVREKKTSEKRKVFSYLNQWFKNRVEVKPKKESLSDRGTDVEKDIFTASDEIKLCFPKLDAELSALEAKAKEIQDKIASTEKEIIYRKEQKGVFYEAKLKKLERHEKRVRSFHKAITDREKDFHLKENRQKQKEKYLTQKMTEGYELGNWFAKHNPTGTIIPKIP